MSGREAGNREIGFVPPICLREPQWVRFVEAKSRTVSSFQFKMGSFGYFSFSARSAPACASHTIALKLI
jgi:hypothetical protein